MTGATYNEIEPYPVAWLRNLIAAGHIAPGIVEPRSIRDLQPEDVQHAAQAHYFAGIGIWSHALRLAGWRDDLARLDRQLSMPAVLHSRTRSRRRR